jgi:hypothetical protein
VSTTLPGVLVEGGFGVGVVRVRVGKGVLVGGTVQTGGPGVNNVAVFGVGHGGL